MKLADNFSLSEFEASDTAARLGIDNSIPANLMPNLMQLVTWLQIFHNRLTRKFNRQIVIRISSGYRSDAVNKSVGGSSRSAHSSALAADFKVDGFTVEEVFELIRELMTDTPADQVIQEFGRWIHVAVAVKGFKPRYQFLEAIKREGKTVYLPR